jgi:sugar phosphate isomerase/epimerase
MRGDIYVSSLAFAGMQVGDMIEIVKQNGWGLEFSSGMAYQADMEYLYLKSTVKRMPHNYFPAPKVPFVLNLASSDETIRSVSVNHCLNGLRLAKQSNSPFFAAHAGFCIDPHPVQLGREIPFYSHFNRENNKELFLKSIEEILITAEQLEQKFLIENNVIAGYNYNNNINPFLCCESSEIEWLCNSFDNKLFGILLDTAHLKVSCQTLGQDKKDEFKVIQPFVKGIHHSDNDGTKDDNLPLSNDYWFLPFMKESIGIPHVLEVKDLSVCEVNEQIKYLETLWN